ISEGLTPAPRDGVAVVRIWQSNVGKRIIAHVPMKNGEVVEEGEFELDGVTFPSAEMKIEFLDPGGADEEEGGALFPTGRLIDILDAPDGRQVEATLINAGNPTIFVAAERLGFTGAEQQSDVND